MVVSKNGPVLYPVPHTFSSIRQLKFLPVCSAPKIGDGMINDYVLGRSSVPVIKIFTYVIEYTICILQACTDREKIMSS